MQQGYQGYQYHTIPQPLPHSFNGQSYQTFVPPNQPATPFIPPMSDGVVIPNTHSKRKRRSSNPTSSTITSSVTAISNGTTHAIKQTIPTATKSSNGTAELDPNSFPRPRTRSVNKMEPFSMIPGFKHHGAELLQATDPEFRPLHMFMSIYSSNGLRLENIPKLAVDELRETILTMWPYGVEKDELSKYDWTVSFRNSPWTATGEDRNISWNMIVQMFTLFSRRGFAFQTSVNISRPPCRLIFAVNPPDLVSTFFLGYFSQGGHKFTLFSAPTRLVLALKVSLSTILPRKVIQDRVINDKFSAVELKRRRFFDSSDVRPGFFMMLILKIMCELGFNLDAAIPLCRRPPFFLRSSRELLVFKTPPPS